ncbi:MAG: hypothetical protein B7Z62_07775 [Deltaproteobacteria bacterium 37-65-8]|nr:MAG: hypothetical protein B7Z62_07775 [Deltaproteobacteria bacterium 37-65-8]
MKMKPGKRMVAVRFLPGLILLVLAFHGVSAFGEEIPAVQPPVPEIVKPENEAIFSDNGYVDRFHEFVDVQTYKVVSWFDSLFGKKSDPDAKKTEIKLKWSNELRAEKGGGIKYRSPLNATVRLPKFEKKLKLVIMEETRQEAVTPIPSEAGTPIANTPTEAKPLRAVHTELRYYAHETKAGYAFLAVGSRLVWLPETFVRARFLWRRSLGNNTFISPSVTPFWQDHLGFGVTPQLDFGHTFAHDYIFLWANSATAFEKRLGFLWGTEVSLSRILSPVHGIAITVGATGATRPSAIVDRFNLAANNYKVAVTYRRNIYRPWLFLELIPETNWRRDATEGRDIVPAFTVRLEINTEGHRALLPVPLIVKEELPIPYPRYDE